MDPAYLESIVKKELRTKNMSSGFWEGLMGFYHAVDWNESWIMSIIIFQLVLFSVVIYGRNKHALQLPMLFFICGAVLVSRHLNAIGAENWKHFSSQNYFDQNGIFVGAVFAGPLLVTGFVHLIFVLKTAANLLIVVKRAEFRVKRQESQQKGSDSDKQLEERRKTHRKQK
jgi:hypothetical protein